MNLFKKTITQVKAIIASDPYKMEIIAQNHTIITDEPSDLSGKDLRFPPMELFGGIAGILCAHHIVVSRMQTMENRKNFR